MTDKIRTLIVDSKKNIVSVEFTEVDNYAMIKQKKKIIPFHRKYTAKYLGENKKDLGVKSHDVYYLLSNGLEKKYYVLEFPLWLSGLRS